MIYFTCSYCEKPISCMAIVVDKTHFAHSACLSDFKKKIQEDNIKKVVKHWEDSGLLTGLKGNIKPEIAKLFESCESSIINEEKV